MSTSISDGVASSVAPTTSSKPVVRTTGLSKRFGETLALDELDLEVPAGVVFGYLGPNGAGKTTTIKLLVGLLRPTAGRAEILGLGRSTRLASSRWCIRPRGPGCTTWSSKASRRSMTRWPAGWPRPRSEPASL